MAPLSSGVAQSYNFCILVIGSTISHYRIVEKLGEAAKPKRSRSEVF
jgi:hypothetical protein